VQESPLSASPYEILGVGVHADDDELRRAYRRRLRETHPDIGGSADAFRAVQEAWQRIGTPEARAAYDSGRPEPAADDGYAPHHPRADLPHGDTRPRARSYGHPGGWRRERYLAMIRLWVGRGTEIDDPYDPALVRSAPYDIRHTLADALAEEATARSLAGLGIGYTIWHDVAALDGGKIDHVVLGPTGLFAVQSEDFGGAVTLRRGEIVGAGVEGRPLHELETRARRLGHAFGVTFAGMIVVLPDDALDRSVVEAGRLHGAALLVVQSSVLVHQLRTGLRDVPRAAGVDLFEVRTRLQQGVRFV
jgi:hypothetical protein